MDDKIMEEAEDVLTERDNELIGKADKLVEELNACLEILRPLAETAQELKNLLKL